MGDAQDFAPLIVQALANAQRPGAPAELAGLAADARIVEAVARFAAWDRSTPSGILEGFDASDRDGGAQAQARPKSTTASPPPSMRSAAVSWSSRSWPRRSHGASCRSPARATFSNTKKPPTKARAETYCCIDDRRAGLKSTHGWYACANHDLPMFGALSGIVHVDGKGSRLGGYLLPAGDTISEPVFVERGKDAAEGDGWLLAAVWRARENRSDLAVFNATDTEVCSVALAQLGHRVPDGFHGNWVGAA